MYGFILAEGCGTSTYTSVRGNGPAVNGRLYPTTAHAEIQKLTTLALLSQILPFALYLRIL